MHAKACAHKHTRTHTHTHIRIHGHVQRHTHKHRHLLQPNQMCIIKCACTQTHTHNMWTGKHWQNNSALNTEDLESCSTCLRHTANIGWQDKISNWQQEPRAMGQTRHLPSRSWGSLSSRVCACNVKESSSSSSSAFPSYTSGVHHFWVWFLRMWPFSNPTIKLVTFRLRGWCVLGMFLLPAFTRLGHERQDLLSPCTEMRVCTD